MVTRDETAGEVPYAAGGNDGDPPEDRRTGPVGSGPCRVVGLEHFCDVSLAELVSAVLALDPAAADEPDGPAATGDPGDVVDREEPAAPGSGRHRPRLYVVRGERR